MSAKSLNLDALMFSPNFDEYPDEPDSLTAEGFKFPFRVFLAGVVVGAIVSGTVICKINSSNNSMQLDLSRLTTKVCKLFS
jgi:hypothetical protein